MANAASHSTTRRSQTGLLGFNLFPLAFFALLQAHTISNDKAFQGRVIQEMESVLKATG